MTSTNIAKYSENNLNGAKSCLLKLVRLVPKGLGVPLPDSLIIAKNRFQARKDSRNLRSIKLTAQ
jgi:hypothetical protein